jgi:hypothetical protein
MPVPRIFQSPSDPREQWAHVLATVLSLSGPETRAALVKELVGEELPGVADAQVREFRPLGGGALVCDVVVMGPNRAWVIGIQSTLAFDADMGDLLNRTYDGLDGMGERRILVAITPDRAPTASITAASGGVVRHKRWQRVRDWIQERPERGNAQGVDAFVLREADYVLNARTAELYRLEELMPLIPEAVRPAFAAAYFDLDDVHTAPRVTGSGKDWIVGVPRTGDAAVEIALSGGAMRLSVQHDDVVPGAVADSRPGWQTLEVACEADYTRARSAVQAAARAVLAPKR